MAEKDVNFEVDERTSVPTFQEVSEMFSNATSKVREHPHGKKVVISLIGFFALIIVAGGIYLFLDNSEGNSSLSGLVISEKGVSSKLTGFFTYEVNESDPDRFGIGIKGKTINLNEEEKHLNDELSRECREEKLLLETNMENDCQEEKDSMQDGIDEWESKYEDCSDKLDDCDSA